MNRASNRFFPMAMLVMALAIVTMKCNITITTGTPERITQDPIYNNSLKSLTLSGNGKWDNKFNSKVLKYSYEVPNRVKSVTLTPEASSRKSKITINDKVCRSDEESKPIFLKVGKNEIAIQVKAENGAEQEYTVTVERLAPGVISDDNFLKSLTLSGNGSWAPTFKSNILNYTYEVPNTVKSITLTPRTSSNKSKITINEKESKSNKKFGPISLEVGRTEIVIQVTAEDGGVREYKIIVERLTPDVKKSNDNFLKSLYLSGNGSWEHRFKPEVLKYTYTVPNRIKSITLTPRASSNKAKITINGKECKSNEKSEPVSLTAGMNKITIGVTAENGEVREYTVMAERLGGKSGDNSLTSLTLSGTGSLNPEFKPDELNYSYEVPHTVESITLTPTSKSNKSKITINGKECRSNEKSPPISLSVGRNEIVIKVTAENSEVQEYTVTVERLPEPSGDNSLKSLTLSGNGAWDPKFKPNVLNYTYKVPNAVGSVTLTPDANSNKSKIMINGKECKSNEQSAPISLKVGKNVLTIQVTAENGNVQKYVVTVERPEAKNNDNSLKSLTLSGEGLLNREFKPDVLNYTYKVPNAVESITLIPNANSNKSKITVNGKECKSNQESEPASLTVGKNEIAVQVTAESGKVRKYAVNVERLSPEQEKDDNAALTSLTISGASLIPGFNPFILQYTASLSEAKASLKVNAAAQSANATIIIKHDGNVVENQQEINFTGSKTKLVIEVIAGNISTRRIYTITVTNTPGLPKASLRGSEIVEKGEEKE